MTWIEIFMIYLLGVLCSALFMIADEKKCSQKSVDRFNQNEWATILCASLFWPPLILLFTLVAIGKKLFYGKLSDILTKDIMPKNFNQGDINSQVDYIDSINFPFNSQNVFTADNVGMPSALMFPERQEERQEGKEIHIIGIMPSKMVNSYETNKSVTKIENSFNHSL